MSDADFDKLVDANNAILCELIRTPATNAQDVCAKLVAVTDFGEQITFVRPDWSARLATETKALFVA